MIDRPGEHPLAGAHASSSPLAIAAATRATVPSQHGARKPRKRRNHEYVGQDQAHHWSRRRYGARYL